MKTKLLSLMVALSLSSCCTALGPAINAAEELGNVSDNASVPVKVLIYPVQVVALAVIFPALGVCWILDDIQHGR